MKRKVVTIIVPVLDEEGTLPELVNRLGLLAIERPDVQWHFLFINDGSTDRTGELLDAFAQQDSQIQAIHLARNFGHQAAVTAGLQHADGDYVGIIDGDLQDPPEVLLSMLARLEDGYNLSFGLRTRRKQETFFKRATAVLFYRLLSTMSRSNIPEDAGDFRMFDQKVLAAVLQLPEYHRFIRGMIAWVGFRSVAVPYERDQRFAGKTKYSIWGMLRFALDAIFSFSLTPLKFATHAGMLTVAGGISGLAYVGYNEILDPSYDAGPGAMFFAILLVGGAQLLGLGVLGEYVGRIFEQSKHRPIYVVDYKTERSHLSRAAAPSPPLTSTAWDSAPWCDCQKQAVDSRHSHRRVVSWTQE